MANASTAKASSRLITPPFRVSFPSVFEKASYNNGVPRFSVVGLFYPKQFTELDKIKWKAMFAALDKVSIEAFKKSWQKLDRGIYKTPVHNGDEKDYQGYGDAAMRYFTMANSKRRPQIVDMNGNLITTENSEEFYAGCWARASVNPYAFNNIGKGLAFGLGNLKKLKDDQSFEGFTSAEDDFGGEDEDFAGGDADDEFGVGGDAPEENDDPTA